MAERAEFVLFEVMRERRRTWVRAKHRDGTRTGWHLIGKWSDEIRAEIVAELERLRTAVL